jgi:exopolysaccharide biosynthesis polyprenyl glycosylphosphotransferase
MTRVIRSLVPAHSLSLFVTEACLMCCCYVLACYLMLDVDPLVYLLYDGGMGRIGIIVGTLLGGIYLNDLYTSVRVRSRLLLVQKGLQVLGLTFILQALLGYVDRDLTLPRWTMLVGSGLTLACFVGWRLFYSAVVLRASGEERLLVLGNDELIEQISQKVARRPELGMRVAAPPAEEDVGAAGGGGAGGVARPSALREAVERTRADRVVVAMRERRGRVPLHDLLELRFSGILIEESSVTFERVFKRVSLRDLRPSQLIYTGELGPRRRDVDFQLVYSTLIAIAAAVLTAPLMLVIAIGVKATSKGPVLYRQTRVGRGGRTFTLYKFRSMREDAETSSGAVWAAKDDPRVTRVGRWLRRLRLDELPQFFNVLKGEMSIVGPRPERPEFVRQLSETIPFYPQRHCVRPGITGWAQINHKYGDTLEDAERKLEYDLYYIKNMSPAFDFYIMFHTAKTVLLRRGSQ